MNLIRFAGPYKGAIALWSTLIALMIFAEVGICATAATELGPQYLLLAAPACLAFNVWSIYEMRDLPQLIRQNRQAAANRRAMRVAN